VANLKDKIDNALNETRIMVLGVQVPIGFGFRAVFEPGFQLLPHTAKLVELVSLYLFCVTLALLVAPSADHRICERGQDTTAFHSLATTFADLALLPFAFALGLAVAIANFRIHTRTSGAVLTGVLVTIVVLGLWYGVELLCKEAKTSMSSDEKTSRTPLSAKVRQVLTEARVVLPGAQAMLGFQLATIFAMGFDELPVSLKWIHFGSLLMTLLAVALLIMPAAWHRIVERGEETERFHHIASSIGGAGVGSSGLWGSWAIFMSRPSMSPTRPTSPKNCRQPWESPSQLSGSGSGSFGGCSGIDASLEKRVRSYRR
jgi:hypothetical protein